MQNLSGDLWSELKKNFVRAEALEAEILSKSVSVQKVPYWIKRKNSSLSVAQERVKGYFYEERDPVHPG